jgi:outer membrane murein-binding lipoprotein Lpp
MNDTDPDELSLPYMRLKRKAAHSKWGWLTALITASASIIGQLLQVRASDAQKLELVAGSTSLDAKIEQLRSEVNHLSQRITTLEVKMDERIPHR